VNGAQRRDRPVRRRPSPAELARAAAARRRAREQALRWSVWTVACTAAGAFVASWLPANVALVLLGALAGWGVWAAWHAARRDIASAHADAPVRLRVRGIRLPPAAYDLDQR